MSKRRKGRIGAALTSLGDRVASWWRRATGRVRWNRPPTARQVLLYRLRLWGPVLVLVLVLAAAGGIYAFAGWRARDLAAQGRDSARAGDLAMARMQVASAANLFGRDLTVRRTQVFIESRANNPAALGQWRDLVRETALTPEELEERARLAIVVGTDAEFESAVAAVPPGTAAALRSARFLRRGSLGRSIEEARASAADSDEPMRQLALLRALTMRQAMSGRLGIPGGAKPDDTEEIIGLVDRLQATPQASAALALGLGRFPLPAERRREWVQAAMQDLSATNPALLPAAQYLVASGEVTAREMSEKLSPLFAEVEVELQGRFARWLNQRGLWDESLALITQTKALQDDVAAYEARTQALAATGQWNELLALAEAPANVPASLRLTVLALAAKSIGQADVAPKALGDALRASVQDGRVGEVLLAADEMNERALADAGLIELCGDPASAEVTFRAARERFGRRGKFASLAEAYEKATQASPQAASVQDYRRRLELLSGREVSLEETFAAVATAPLDLAARCTHALALLRLGRAGEALATFEDLDVVPEQLAPGNVAVVIAVLEANGLQRQAAPLRETLDLRLLENDEYALVAR